MSWDDIEGEAQIPVAISQAVDEAGALPVAWSTLTDSQRAFLILWRNNEFCAADAYRAQGRDPRGHTHSTWMRIEEYALCAKLLKKLAMPDALDKAHNVLALERLANKLEAPKDILYQGVPTGHFEAEYAAAAKVRETLLRTGGHLKDEQISSYGQGPQLIVQVTNKIGGEVETHTVIGVVPELPPPEEDSWLSTR